MRKSNAQKRISYPSRRADALEKYVRHNIPLSRTAHHLYAAARWLEMKKSCFLGLVVAGYDELVATARIDVGSVKQSLLELQEKGLMAVMPFNWRVQGSVADIINPVCLQLLDITKVVIPMHDAIYAVLPSMFVEGYLAEQITARAREIGIAVKVQSEVKKLH